MDEILEGVTWALAHDPTMGMQILGHRLWAYPTYPWPGAPGLVLYYTFDDENVTLESIQPEMAGW